MKRLLIRWVLMVVALLIAASLTNMIFPGKFQAKVGTVGDFLMLMLGVAVLAFVNATLGTIVKVLTLPLTCLTLGLFALVVNALMLLVVGNLGIGFEVHEFMPAFVGSLLLSAANAVMGAFVPQEDDKE